MKAVAIISALLMVLYLCGPAIFRAMKAKDYDNLYNGMRETRAHGGAMLSEEESGHYQSYSDRLVNDE